MSFKKTYLIFIWMFLFVLKVNASTKSFLKDSSQKDSAVVSVHSPKTATILAIALPGAGQIYNQKYWKVPIVYGALGYSIYSLIQNQNSLNEMNDTFKNMYARGLIPSKILTNQRDGYRINRDVSIIALSVVYVLQVIDATVDAHFFKFDINQSLSARIAPTPTTFIRLSYKLQ